MNSTINPLTEVLTQELGLLQKHWRWFLVLGIAMVVLGLTAVSYACIATVTMAATVLFGFFLIAGGIGEIVQSFWVGRWSGMLLHLLVGVIYALVGFMVIDQPAEAAVQLTLLIAIFLMVTGIFRIVFAVAERFAGSGWVLLNGVVTFILGLMIYKQWPASSLWVIGLFIGIDLIFNGISWIMLSLGLHRFKPAVELTTSKP
jgi:uncharacterized membrane protein HdeD (DUF308 family)